MADHDKLLLALADRCKVASGVERKLDGDIADAFKLVPPWVSSRDNPEWASWSGGRDHWEAPFFTGRIDDALTLMPSGVRRVEFGTYAGGDGAWAYVHIPDDRVGQVEGCATEPLALTEAILRALAGEQPAYLNNPENVDVK